MRRWPSAFNTFALPVVEAPAGRRRPARSDQAVAVDIDAARKESSGARPELNGGSHFRDSRRRRIRAVTRTHAPARMEFFDGTRRGPIDPSTGLMMTPHRPSIRLFVDQRLNPLNPCVLPPVAVGVENERRSSPPDGVASFIEQLVLNHQRPTDRRSVPLIRSVVYLPQTADGVPKQVLINVNCLGWP
jgi:hypothetical protein